jgi:purine nucleosidase
MLSHGFPISPDRYREPGSVLHDPCVIAYLLDPALMSGKSVNVEIELESELRRGQTVADWWGVTERPPNCLVLDALDSEAFFDLLFRRLRSLAESIK